MATITAAQVNELRKMTGAGMMDCKKALIEANGDIDEAVTVLRKTGATKAAKKSDRETVEGATFAKSEGGKAVLVAIGCETDFVARNDKFQSLGQEILDLAFTKGPEVANTEGAEKVTAQAGVIGENIKLVGVSAIEGDITGAYVHSNGKIGVIVALKGGSEEVASDIAMHAAAMNPLVLNPSDISEELVEKEKEIWIDQLKQEGKPENIIENILKGKEKKFREEGALTAQSFVKDPSQTIAQYAKSKGAEVLAFNRIAV